MCYNKNGGNRLWRFFKPLRGLTALPFAIFIETQIVFASQKHGASRRRADGA
ncbi:MAG: hypothetical protein K2J77_02795 [Oscillospiraceae bacterium]|nr:hypothetical protein [Oscillospiraceae bacterium]